MLSGIAQSHHSRVVLDDKVKPKSIGSDIPTSKLVEIYTGGEHGDGSAVGAYDGGSTALVGAQGVARMAATQQADPCRGSHWSVAVQGNLALWGYSLPATMLTAEGRQIFAELAAHMRDSDYVAMDRSRTTVNPGDISGQLGCGLVVQDFRFRPSGPGAIKVTAHADREFTLVLNGPIRVGALARDDAVDPKVTFQVEPQHLQVPGFWRAHITYFGDLQPNETFPFTGSLEYPYTPDHSRLWIWLAIPALILGLLALLQLVRTLILARSRTGEITTATRERPSAHQG